MSWSQRPLCPRVLAVAALVVLGTAARRRGGEARWNDPRHRRYGTRGRCSAGPPAIPARPSGPGADRLGSPQLPPSGWITVTGLALANWLAGGKAATVFAREASSDSMASAPSTSPHPLPATPAPCNCPSRWQATRGRPHMPEYPRAGITRLPVNTASLLFVLVDVDTWSTSRPGGRARGSRAFRGHPSPAPVTASSAPGSTVPAAPAASATDTAGSADGYANGASRQHHGPSARAARREEEEG